MALNPAHVHRLQLHKSATSWCPAECVGTKTELQELHTCIPTCVSSAPRPLPSLVALFGRRRESADRKPGSSQMKWRMLPKVLPLKSQVDESDLFVLNNIGLGTIRSKAFPGKTSKASTSMHQPLPLLFLANLRCPGSRLGHGTQMQRLAQELLSLSAEQS